MAELQHVGQHQRVGKAVGNSVLATQLMRYRVHIADIHLVDGEARVIGTHRHTRPGVEVAAVMIGRGQILEYQLYAQACIFQPTTALPHADVGLDAMGKGVHAGGGGNMRRQAHGQGRVQRSGGRQQRTTGNNALLMGLGIGDNRSHGGLGAGTGCGRNHI